MSDKDGAVLLILMILFAILTGRCIVNQQGMTRGEKMTRMERLHENLLVGSRWRQLTG